MRIIYVDVDTLRADHTTPYEYHRPTTPNLQKLADKSVTFDRYYCSDSPCLPSRTTLNTACIRRTSSDTSRHQPRHKSRPQDAEVSTDFRGSV